MGELRLVDAAREHLLADGVIPRHLEKQVRPQVLQSWKRSLQSGAQLANPTLTFKGEHHARAALRLAADPVLSRLAEQLAGLEAGVLLADHEATLVHRWMPDRSVVPMFDRINANSGFDNSEESIGTNGCGSVIEAGSSIQVSGPEHLAEALRPFTCVGVPVHHPITRRLEAVVTLSCRATSGNPLLTPLMTSTAQEVESRLLAQATTSERQLLDAYLVAIGSRRAPIAAVGQDIFIAGPKVTDLLEGIDRALLWEYVRGVALGSRADAARFGLATGGRFRITHCQPVERDGSVIGALVEFEVARPEREPTHGPDAGPLPRPTVSLPGQSPALVTAIAHATRLAAKGVPMLIEGESGVGKFALAKAVLAAAPVPEDKVVVLDAAAGWSEGAAQFVTELRRALEAAPEAVLLRHLEQLSPEAAAATASLLEEGDGDAEPLPRIVATMTSGGGETSHSLRRLVDTIGVGRVTVPPLRDRHEDIGPTAAAMLEKHRGDRPLHFSSSALRLLMRAPWPGNLRQLDATIRGVMSTCIGPEITPDALPVELQGNSRKRDLSAIEELELGAILNALKQHHGNKVAAAQSIGISRSTLYRKLQAYRLDPDTQYF
ncbi:helix-turn-helix domain-containing protein [Nocardioides sp.]|uniref:sigma-54-dependent Fis family transcriptional regulator n=1 Tax=Nocardioides sp. TaxID=35761 RepID=UPI001A1F6092|nr:helix-turn-helix domain-containing protein [Nocardioides sp.]MBJ7357764.1 sigma 54-interacting transcriptional regulator [Nocardioides sp.]